MTAPTILALLAIILGGAAVATQAPINARLAAAAGDPIIAAAISVLVSLSTYVVVMVIRGKTPDIAGLTAAPWWVWSGGILGAFFVWAALWSVGQVGALTFVAALVFGQLAAALIIDTTGAFGLAVREISATRLLAIGLVAAGLVLSRT